ncbi:VOC family protein [Actinokineospora sp. NPDC004072]
MLEHSRVAARIPAADLDRARAFYAEKLGLRPVAERPGGLLYRCGGAEFALFRSAGAASGEHTQLAWEVDDLDAAMALLRSRGVEFLDYPFTVDGIAEVAGHYPGKGTGERAAWFRDSEGNLLGIGQAV